MWSRSVWINHPTVEVASVEPSATEVVELHPLAVVELARHALKSTIDA
jgi:hypothetical protein